MNQEAQAENLRKIEAERQREAEAERKEEEDRKRDLKVTLHHIYLHGVWGLGERKRMGSGTSQAPLTMSSEAWKSHSRQYAA